MVCSGGAFHSLSHCVDLKNNVELNDDGGDGDDDSSAERMRAAQKKNECRLIRESILDAATRIMF